MATSMLEIQRQAILQAIRDGGRGEWKVLIVDESSWRLITNVLKEDDILNEKIMNIEHIEQRRQTNRDSDALYILTPEPHIVECVLADFGKRRYRHSTLLWTSVLPLPLRALLDKSDVAQQQHFQLKVIDVGFYPRESQLVTFRDPWSFPILFHQGCDNLISKHLTSLAQKIVSVCASLGEYPHIRYYSPRTATHAARVLSSHLARFVQDELDKYATFHQDFPPPSTRPRGTLYILDRSIDLMSPLIHDFTYQAMVHDLLPIKEGDTITYRIKVNEGRPDQQDKDVEISEKDKIWLANRHKHMKDTIDKLMGEFQKFIDENPHFTNADANSSNSLNAIKDMLAGLPQFQETKEAYSLHLTMAQESMNIFQQCKLGDLASVEQALATGLDEDYKRPKNIADQLVRLLDEESVVPQDRLRLLLLYILYRNGLLAADTTKLLAHAQLPPQDDEVIGNLEHLGANITRSLKDTRPAASPLFGKPQAPPGAQEDYALSRYQPAVKSLLSEHSRGILDQTMFPYTKPHMDTTESLANDVSVASLRSAKPTWANSRASSTKPKQRVLVFMAGGATYAESRACYEATADRDKDVYLITSHMLTPSLFIRQVRDLSTDPRRLGIPAMAPPKKAPAHLFESDPPPQPPRNPPQTAQTSIAPSSQMANLRLGSQNGTSSTSSASATAPKPADRPIPAAGGESKKKIRNIFSSKKG